MPPLPLSTQVQFHIVHISHWTPFLLILLSPPFKWHVGDGEWWLQLACNTLHLPLYLPDISSPAPAWSSSWGLQSFMNCSFTWVAVLQWLFQCGPLHGVQPTRNALLQQGSAMDCSSCQHLLLHFVPTVCSLLLCTSTCCDPGPSTGLRVDLCSPIDLQEHSSCKRKHNRKGTREEPLLQLIDTICWLCQAIVLMAFPTIANTKYYVLQPVSPAWGCEYMASKKNLKKTTKLNLKRANLLQLTYSFLRLRTPSIIIVSLQRLVIGITSVLISNCIL